MTAIQPTPLPSWAEPYIEALREHGMEHTAAATAGTTVRAVRKLQETNEEFAYAVEAALEISADAVEAEVRRRAIEGIEKGVYYQGELMATEKQYSDSLLLALAKAKRRREFGDKAEISGPGGAPLTINIRSFTPPEVAEANAALAAARAVIDITPSLTPSIPAPAPAVSFRSLSAPAPVPTAAPIDAASELV